MRLLKPCQSSDEKDDGASTREKNETRAERRGREGEKRGKGGREGMMEGREREGGGGGRQTNRQRIKQRQTDRGRRTDRQNNKTTLTINQSVSHTNDQVKVPTPRHCKPGRQNLLRQNESAAHMDTLTVDLLNQSFQKKNKNKKNFKKLKTACRREVFENEVEIMKIPECVQERCGCLSPANHCVYSISWQLAQSVTVITAGLRPWP